MRDDRSEAGQEDEEVKQLALFIEEAIRELNASGGVPDTVMGVMLKLARHDLGLMLASGIGLDRAVATVAAAAFFAGRKAERAGLSHVPN